VTATKPIDVQPWMNAPATRAVMDALSADGGEARFVGGCVRDTITGQVVHDIDIATHEPPDRVMALLQRANLKAVPTGIAHGTVTAVVDKEHFEITTLRLDVATDGRRADVAFTEDWVEDAARRDFTINALSMTMDGIVHDPFGGLDDLDNGRVRFVGDPETRIKEDVLRILRFFRFHGIYDKAGPDGAALAAIKNCAHLLPTLSGERVWAELTRIFLNPAPVSVLRLMHDVGALVHILPEAQHFDRLEALAAIEENGPDPVLRLAALIETDKAGALKISQRLRHSNHDRDRLAGLCVDGGMITEDITEVDQRRSIYRFGNPLYCDLVLLSWAEQPNADYRAVLAYGRDWPRPEFPVRGSDVLALGVDRGPAVGQLVEQVEEWWIEEDFRPDRAACLEKLRKIASNPSA
jgi:poly(A) polymerase